VTRAEAEAAWDKAQKVHHELLTEYENEFADRVEVARAVIRQEMAELADKVVRAEMAKSTALARVLAIREEEAKAS
jgi:hypothetical protein